MHLRLSLSAALLLAAPALVQAQLPTTPADHASTAIQSIPLDRIVAIVGDVVISQSNLQERIIQKKQDGVNVPSDTAAFRDFIKATVNELVDEELILQKAKELKIEVPDADVSSTVDKQVKEIRKRFTSETEFKSELAKAGYGTPEEFRRFRLTEIKRNETITRTIKKLREDGKIVQANVTDSDVSEAYDRAKGSLPKREAAVTWRQIIVTPHPAHEAEERARQHAESLLVELKAGADFEKLAKRESADAASKDNGGDLGWNRRGKMVAEFDRVMFALQPGELSPVIKTAFGFHIIRVDSKNPSEVKARHILIAPKIDSLDVARAHVEADSVRTLWLAGVPFDTLARKHHDYPSGEETSLLTPFPRAQLPAPYQEAFANKHPKDVVVFRIPGSANIPFKYVVAQIASVEEGGDLTLAEVKERFRTRLAEEGGIKHLMESLRKATYVSVRADSVYLAPPQVPTVGAP